VDIIVNPILDTAFDGFKNLDFAPAERIDYNVDKTWAIALEHSSLIHDFVVTDRFLVFMLSPLSYSPVCALLGLETPASSLRARGRSQVMIVPREGGPARMVPVEDGFVFHFANGYERGDTLVVDGFRMATLPDLRGSCWPEARLTRFTIDAAVSLDVLSEHPGELPQVATRGRHRFVWAVGTPSSILKIDGDARETRRREFGDDLPSEPIFVPRPNARGEDDGYLLVVVYVAASHCSELLILDAADLSDVARLRLPTHLPPGFHGMFA